MIRNLSLLAQTLVAFALFVFFPACDGTPGRLVLTVDVEQSIVDARWYWVGLAPDGVLEYRLLQRSSDTGSFFVIAVTEGEGAQVSVSGSGIERFRVDAWRGSDLVGRSNEVTALVDTTLGAALPQPDLITVTATATPVVSRIIWGPENRNCAGKDVQGGIHFFLCRSLEPVSRVTGFQGEMLAWSPSDSGLVLGRFGAFEIRDINWNVLGGHSETGWGLVRSVAFETTGTVFVAAGRIIDRVDLDHGMAERVWTNTSNVETIDICAKRVGIGDEEGNLVVLDTAGSVPPEVIPVAGSAVQLVRWHRDCASMHVVSTNGATTLLAEQTDGWKVTGRLDRGALSPDGRFVAWLESGGNISVFPVTAPSLVAVHQASILQARTVSWSSDARYLMILGAGMELLEVNEGAQE